MRNQAKQKYGLEMTEAHLPSQTLEQVITEKHQRPNSTQRQFGFINLVDDVNWSP